MKSLTVVMAIYTESESMISEAIESILNQTYSDFDLYIVNDNPGKNINSNIIGKYKKIDNRIIEVFNEKNIGLTKSLNKGISLLIQLI